MAHHLYIHWFVHVVISTFATHEYTTSDIPSLHVPTTIDAENDQLTSLKLYIVQDMVCVTQVYVIVIVHVVDGDSHMIELPEYSKYQNGSVHLAT